MSGLLPFCWYLQLNIYCCVKVHIPKVFLCSNMWRRPSAVPHEMRGKEGCVSKLSRLSSNFIGEGKLTVGSVELLSIALNRKTKRRERERERG